VDEAKLILMILSRCNRLQSSLWEWLAVMKSDQTKILLVEEKRRKKSKERVEMKLIKIPISLWRDLRLSHQSSKEANSEITNLTAWTGWLDCTRLASMEFLQTKW
jgi:hypothetical protein